MPTSTTDRFHENIQYLAKNHRAVYNKLLEYDKGIESNQYQSRYELGMNDDYFEVVKLSTGDYFYDLSSKKYALIAKNSVNFKKNENVFQTFKLLPIEAEVDVFVDIAPTLRYIKNNIKDNSEMKSIKKFIFFGTGLGTHIPEIDTKLNAEMYLIVEDDIEIFKLSLFVTAYYELANKAKLTFSIADTKEQFVPIANNFLMHKFYFNHYIKYFEMIQHTEEKLKAFHLQVISQSQNIFFYKDILTQYLTPVKYMQKNFMFLNMLASYEKTSLNMKPVILLAAGPSLQINIEWIKNNQDKFIIVALSSILNILEKESILPDIVTHMDAFESSVVHFDKLKSLEFLDNTLFLFSARIQKSIVNRLPKENIFFFENGTTYKQNIGNLSAPCVGSTTYLILLALGVKELYLLGLDLSLDKKTGADHAEAHHFNQTLDLETVDKHEDIMQFANTVVKRAGNFQKEVYTKPEFTLSIDSINASSMGFKKEYQNVYNLNDGAYFGNTIPQKIATIDTTLFETIDKKSLFKELKDNLTNEASSVTTQNELDSIKRRIEYALKLKKIVNNQQTYKFSTQGEFLGSLDLLFARLASGTSAESYDLSLILQEYCKFIYTFVFDFFNTAGIEDENKHVSVINNLLSEAFLRILDEYRDKLEEGSHLNLR